MSTLNMYRVNLKIFEWKLLKVMNKFIIKKTYHFVINNMRINKTSRKI